MSPQNFVSNGLKGSLNQEPAGATIPAKMLGPCTHSQRVYKHSLPRPLLNVDGSADCAMREPTLKGAQALGVGAQRDMVGIGWIAVFPY